MRTKEEIKEYNKKYYQENKKHFLQYRLDNKESRAAYIKGWRKVNKESCVASLKEWRQVNKEKQATLYRQRQYGMSDKEFQDKRFNQNNKCAICFKLFINTPSVDHDHTTGKFRGLLCRRCNVALGFVDERIEILENAIQYLKKYQN
jgi:Autographiviridae endonuclease VII